MLNFFKTLLFIVCLPSCLLIGSPPGQETQHSCGPPPSWVEPQDFSIDLPVKPSEVNFHQLLFDSQRNWEEKTSYYHQAFRTLSQSGIEAGSKIEIDFDPNYQEVLVHTLRVFRDGQWIDQLEGSRYDLIQKEKDLDNNIFRGRLTLLYFLDDIRRGDIIEYAYSVMGELPLAASSYTDRIPFQWSPSVEKRTHRFLSHPSHHFSIKTVNTELEPQIRDLSPSLREWFWEDRETVAYTTEPNEPMWCNLPAEIEMSEYGSWEEVSQAVFPLYQLPVNFAESIPSEMSDLVESWKSNAQSEQEAALFALRFVQDEIRFLGFGGGMKGFHPTDPCQTLQKRFGDCKDKTFLLHALLKLMDIPSRPTLVHTSHGSRLPEKLPSPFLFNHVVLQIEIDGTTYWVDPVYPSQGGSLETSYCPDHQWGLLLSEDSNGLAPIPRLIPKRPIELESLYIIESENSALLRRKSVYYDDRADRMRRSFEVYGTDKLSKNNLTIMQKAYGAVTTEEPLKFLDDRDNNILTTFQTYRLSIPKFSRKKTIELRSDILYDYLYSNINPERKAPYAIDFPCWVKEHIRVENSFLDWETYEESFTADQEAFYFDSQMKVDEQTAEFDLELKYRGDHIPQEDMREYWDILNEIDELGTPEITFIK